MKTFFLIAIALSAVSQIKAADRDSIPAYILEDVVVTSTRTPLPLKNTPVITRVISGDEIRRQGIPTIENMLERKLAGVEFHQAGYGTTLSFQGLDARYVLFLVDGERIAGETYGNIDYSRIPLVIIDRVEVVRGASSVLYGSNAMGAVVNVITKVPQKRHEVYASVRTGTRFQNNGDELLGEDASEQDLDKYRAKLDLLNFRGDVAAGFNLGKFRSMTTFSMQYTDAYKLHGSEDEERFYSELTKMRPQISMGPTGPTIDFDESGVPVFIPAGNPVQDTTIHVGPDSRGLGVSGWRNYYAGQKFDYTINEKFRLELSGNYSNKERYDFLTSIMDDNPMSGYLRGNDPWKFESYRAYDVKFLMEHSPNENNKVYLSFVRDEYSRYQNQLHAERVPKQRHTYNIPRLLWTLKASDWNRLTTGVEMVNERLRFDLNSTEGGYDDVKSVNTGALYVQDEILSGRSLSFVAGFRTDWSDRFGWRATPKFSAKYTFSDFSLRANYSSGYRLPSLKEMYMVLDIPVASSPKILGNPDLKSETNRYLSLSLDYNRDWLNMSATVSKSYFRNKIDVRRQADEDGRQVMRYENIDKSELGSVEFIGRFRVAKGLILNANYNYIFESDNAPEGSTQYIFPSPHTATFSVDYSFLVGDTRLSANASVRYVGPKDYEDFMPYIDLPEDMVNFIANPTYPIPPAVIAAMGQAKYYTGSYKARHEGYAVCYLAFTADFLKRYAVTLGVDNVFNYRPKVVNFNSALLPGTNGFIQLSAAF